MCGRLVQLQASSTAFDLVDVRTDNGATQMFDIRGDGLVSAHAGLHVTAGGTTVQAGGLTVTDGGMAVHNSDASLTVAQVQASSTGYSGDVMSITSGTTAGSGFDFLQVTADATDVFSIRGDGFTTINQGGLQVVAGGATVQSGQLIVDDGVTVTAGGLLVTAGGLTVADGGAQITNDETSTQVLTVSGTSTGYASSILHVSSDTNSGTGFNIIEADTSTEEVFSLDGAGNVAIRSSMESGVDPSTTFTRSRLVTGSPTTVVAGDIIRSIDFAGYVPGCVRFMAVVVAVVAVAVAVAVGVWGET